MRDDLPLIFESMSLNVFTQSLTAEVGLGFSGCSGVSGTIVFRATVSLELDESSSTMGISMPGDGMSDVTSLALPSGLGSMSGYCRESTWADSDKKGLMGDGWIDSARNIVVRGVDRDGVEYKLPVSTSDLLDLARHLSSLALVLLLRGSDAAGRSAQ